MQNKIGLFGVLVCGMFLSFEASYAAVSFEEDFVVEDIVPEQVSADAVAAYNPDGSLFQQITDLEQEKILMQLEKERAQLDLELDRLAAEKIKLHMEIDTLSGRAEQQKQEIETQKAKLEAEAARIEREKESWLKEIEQAEKREVKSLSYKKSEADDVKKLSESWRLINVIGAGSQLQATIEDLNNGQTRRIGVGKTLDGFTVKSISLYDGVVLVGEDGEVQVLNITNGK